MRHDPRTSGQPTRLVGPLLCAALLLGVVAWPPTAAAAPGGAAEGDDMVFVSGDDYLSSCEPDQPGCVGGFVVNSVDAFLLDRNEVTVAQYEACVAAGACEATVAYNAYCNAGLDGLESHPINCVTYARAEAYCDWMGKRLPKEEEWVRAARGPCPSGDCSGAASPQPWGDAPLDCTRAVVRTAAGKGCGKNATAVIGSRPDGASPEGLLDMVGNVSEYLQSEDPWYPVRRGGSFYGTVASIDHRETAHVGGGSAQTMGIRCAADVDVPAPPPPPVEEPPAVMTIPGGWFAMGCPDGQIGCGSQAVPMSYVGLGEFQIDRTEATVNEYMECVSDGLCSEPTNHHVRCNALHGDRGDHPINCIHAQQAALFCSWRGGRLPTEAEWEKAARGACPEGVDCGEAVPAHPWAVAGPVDCEHAVVREAGLKGCGLDHTDVVGSRPAGASPYGLVDMTGNVAEYVAAYYDEETAGPVKKGGSWYQNGVALAYRDTSKMGGANLPMAGVRCAYGPSEVWHQDAVVVLPPVDPVCEGASIDPATLEGVASQTCTSDSQCVCGSHCTPPSPGPAPGQRPCHVGCTEDTDCAASERCDGRGYCRPRPRLLVTSGLEVTFAAAGEERELVIATEHESIVEVSAVVDGGATLACAPADGSSPEAPECQCEVDEDSGSTWCTIDNLSPVASRSLWVGTDVCADRQCGAAADGTDCGSCDGGASCDGGVCTSGPSADACVETFGPITTARPDGDYCDGDLVVRCAGGLVTADATCGGGCTAPVLGLARCRDAAWTVLVEGAGQTVGVDVAILTPDAVLRPLLSGLEGFFEGSMRLVGQGYTEPDTSAVSGDPVDVPVTLQVQLAGEGEGWSTYDVRVEDPTRTLDLDGVAHGFIFCTGDGCVWSVYDSGDEALPVPLHYEPGETQPLETDGDTLAGDVVAKLFNHHAYTDGSIHALRWSLAATRVPGRSVSAAEDATVASTFVPQPPRATDWSLVAWNPADEAVRDYLGSWGEGTATDAFMAWTKGSSVTSTVPCEVTDGSFTGLGLPAAPASDPLFGFSLRMADIRLMRAACAERYLCQRDIETGAGHLMDPVALINILIDDPTANTSMVAPGSGDLLCTAGSDTWLPTAAPMKYDPAASVTSARELLETCVQELGDGRVEYAEDPYRSATCVNEALLLRGMRHAWVAVTPDHPEGSAESCEGRCTLNGCGAYCDIQPYGCLEDHAIMCEQVPDVGSRLYQRYVQIWLDLHTFVATEGREQARYGLLTGQAAPSREALLEVVSDGLTTLLSPQHGLHVFLHPTVIADPDYRSALAGIPGAPSDDQKLGLPVHVDQSLTAWLDLVRDALAKAALSTDANVRAAALERLAVANRVVTALAYRSARLASLAPSAAWADEYVATRASLDAAHNQALELGARVATESMPYGMGRLDLALYSAAVSGTTSDYRSVSSHLTSMASNAVLQSTDHMEEAQSHYISFVDRQVNDELLAAEQERRLEGIEKTYGARLQELCGNTGGTAEARYAQLLSEDAPPARFCFADETPECGIDALELASEVSLPELHATMCEVVGLWQRTPHKPRLGHPDAETLLPVLAEFEELVSTGQVQGGDVVYSVGGVEYRFPMIDLLALPPELYLVSPDEQVEVRTWCRFEHGAVPGVRAAGVPDPDTDPNCFRGALGQQHTAVALAREALVGAWEAVRARLRTHASLLQDCRRIVTDGAVRARINHEIDEVDEEMRSLGRGKELFGLGFDTVNQVVGSTSRIQAMLRAASGYAHLVGTAAYGVSSGDLARRRASLEAELARFEVEAAEYHCLQNAARTLHGLEADHSTLRQRFMEVGAASARLLDLEREVEGTISEARDTYAREAARPVPRTATVLWVDQALDEMERAMERGRRYSYLAVRAAEYELQLDPLVVEGVVLRDAVAAAVSPQELLETLEQLATWMSVDHVPGGGISTPHKMVVSLCALLRDGEEFDGDRCTSDPVARAALREELRRRLTLGARSTSAGYEIEELQLPFRLTPWGNHLHEGAERQWAVSVLIRHETGGDVWDEETTDQPRVFLRQRNHFFSQWVLEDQHETEWQWAATRPCHNLLNDEVVSGCDENWRTADPDANFSQNNGLKLDDFVDTAPFGNGAAPPWNHRISLANRGLYGDYVLEFSVETLANLDLNRLADIYLRFDYLAVAAP